MYVTFRKPLNNVKNIIRTYCSSSANSKDTQQRNYCIDLVKKNDFENYLCTLLVNGEIRRNAFAIRALNVEIAKIGSSVSEQHIAKMKLKFWFDSIDKCLDKDVKSYVADHPVLYEIKYISERHKITKAYLKRLVTARDRPPNQQFITCKDMEDYADQTVSPIYFLLLEISGVRNLNVDHAASHLGKAQGITNLLRAIPYTRRSEALNIPQEVLIKHGVSQERILRGKADDKGVEDCIFEVATMAHQHLEKARSLQEHIPKSVRPLFLPSIAVDRYLERLRKAHFQLTDQRVLQRDSMLPAALYWNHFRLKY
ncbi:NADH dehydrogenase (ubiquinone) complex I, assembly factor 6 homolog [Eupeodes corollae]|uniref:NADH dehydrogenase (ubiquinone) complex I, assembly factor 6 homolog n=1 Tax=Eupeodes corollae TaxID=290404 RepID=UPI0024916533|nr:NADH dehydrogenase (ubiquinone) complex I, assembly factor 6 homolog [Eupeodes corollae]